MTQINTDKVLTYAVETPTPALHSQKLSAYVVEVISLPITTEKVTVYVTEPSDNTGHARQFTSVNRPVYKSATIPYISFAVDTSLAIDVLENTSWLVVSLSADGETFTETVSSNNTITLTQDFNQVIALRESVATPVYRKLCKANMRSKL